MSPAAEPPFIGRDDELAVLNELSDSGKPELFVLYGRRRVGKTELILQFARDKPSVFYLGKQASSGYQVREFLEIAAEKLGESLLAEIGDPGWKKALKLEGKALERIFGTRDWAEGVAAFAEKRDPEYTGE